MTTINDTYVNALLADASYVNGLTPNDTGLELAGKLSPRMTPTLAAFMAENFTVVTSINTPDNVIGGAGFDGVIWRGNAGTPYAGKVYVSMRGTEGPADFVTDANLALLGDAAQQTADMANWWLRETTPAGETAPQFAWRLLTGSFVGVASAPGVGRVSATDLAGGIYVNGHSLGGFLASTFTRLFGTQSSVLQASTFNSAGFASGSEPVISALQALVGPELGRPTFPGPSDASQLNYFAVHGLNLTTNTWWFSQVGQRVELFNEVSGSQIPNHFMYKLADALVLADAISELDSTTTLARANGTFEAGSMSVAADLEGTLDGLRRVLLGSAVALTAPADVDGSAPTRVQYHANLKALQDSSAFAALAGKVRIDVGSRDLGAKARNDFSALASLMTLSPVVLTATNASNRTVLDAVLRSAWGQTYADWEADLSMSQSERDAGKETFTDSWITDRARLVNAVALQNQRNSSTGLAIDATVPADRIYEFQYYGGSLRPGESQPPPQTLIATSRPGGTLPPEFFAFGDDGANDVQGSNNQRGDHLYGGTGNDTLSGQGGADWLEGNADIDTLTGGTGNDTLLGGKGGDLLEGGDDDDRLLGGQGTDTYVFSGGWGHDIIEDSDGQGSLQAEGFVDGLSGGKKVVGMPGVYRSADDRVTYAVSSDGKTLTIGFDGRSDSIVVRNWQPGQLGIDLDDAPLPPEQYGSAYVDPFDASGNISVAETPPADGHPVPIRTALQLSTSVSIDALGGDDEISTVSRTMYYFVPTAQMLAQVTSDFHRDHVDGGAGNDTIYTGDGRDTILGGAGDDHIYAGLYVPGYYEEGFNSDLPYPNYDSYFLPDGTEVVTTYRFNMGQGEADIQAIVLRDFDESRRRYDSNVVDAGDGADVVYAGWGDDVVHAGTGDDAVLGQAGDDALFGDDGNDSIYGDSLSVHILQEFVLSNGSPFRRFSVIYTPAELHGQDTLDGGGGDDWLFGMGADDTLLGGAGNDSLFGDTDYDSPPPLDPELLVDPEFVPNEFHGSDFLDGGDGADQLVGGARDDWLSGGSGNDRMWGDSDIEGLTIDLHGDDTLDGGDGDDSLMGGGGGDEITGGIGNDSISGDDAEAIVAASAHGDDFIDAGDGDDTVFGGGGSDFIQGEAGNDQIAGDGGTDSTLAGDDWIDGGDGNDLIFGDGGNDWIQGGSGADSLRGGSGADVLEGGAGRDDLSGGAGNDTFRFDVGDSLIDGAGFGEAIRDDGGFDSIAFGAQVDLNSIRVLGDGQSLLAIDYSSTDRVAVDGGLGGTIESFQFANGQSLTWTELVGRVSDTTMVGQTATGTRVGLGGKNDDAVAVAGGLGIVSGGRGNDTLSGSGGGNSYHFSLGDGSDVITDAGGTNPSTGAPLPSSTIVFGEGIVSNDVALTSDEGLVLRVGAGGADRMRIVGFNSGAAGVATNIDRFVFADGTVLDHGQLMARGFDFDGSAGDDSILGTNLTDRFAATAGNDTLHGGAGSDTYGWGRDSGQDRIDDGDTLNQASSDTLRVQSGLTGQDVALYRVGDDLLVRDRAGSATVTVLNHFAGAGVEAITFDDGTSWDAAQILAHLTNELTEGNDNFTGTSGADSIEARGGNDTVHGGGGNDLIDGGVGNDSLLGDAGDDSLVGGAGLDTLAGGTGNDTLNGGESMNDEAGNDTYTLAAWQGTNIFDFGAVGASTDTLVLPVPAADVRVLRGYNLSTLGWDDLVLRANGQTGDIVVQRYFERIPNDETYKIETIRFSDSTVWTIADVFAGDLAIRTTEGNDIGVTGYRWGDVIDGKAGNDGIDGQQGDDTLAGGAGDDAVFGAEGSDSVSGGAGADVLYGGSGNYVQSGDGGDTLEGGSGSDTLYGGGGNDRYRFGRGSDIDRVEEVAGSDRIVLDAGIAESAVTLHRNGQDLVVALDGSAVQLTVANHFTAAANQIEAIEFASGVVWDAAAITAHTAAGAPNAMTGTAGNDTFVVDNAGDSITEAASQGTDTVQSTVNWTLGANLENLTLTGFVSTIGYGNPLDNTITGNLGHNDLSGDAGRDTLIGGAGNDTLRNSGVVTTNDGEADSLVGGAGDDTYWVSAADADLVVEAAAEGIDTVNLRADLYQYVLPVNVENLTVHTMNFSSVTLIGNALNNVITAHRNYSGFVLDGGAGADTLIGAELATTFVVDNVGDVVVARGTDVDTVISSVSWTLDANLEHLRLVTGASLGTGNSLNNKLTGSGQVDTLLGLDGNDTFYGDVGIDYNAVGPDSFVGGSGDDHYFVDWTANSHDVVVEEAGGGNDTVSINGMVRTYSAAEFLNVEVLTLQQASGASNLIGNGADNRLVGNSYGNTLAAGDGDDTLVDGDSASGGAGDVLSGGAGSDTLTSWYGYDSLDGGAGNDLVQWASTSSWGTVVFGWGMGSDLVHATGAGESRRILFNADVQPADLQLSRTDADLRISLGEGADSLTIVGFFADAASWAASGNIGTFEFADGAYFSAQALAARAQAGNSNVASAGNDLLLGSGAGDTLEGLGGNDQLLGGLGDDDLAGNAGSDTVFGGAGGDVYRFAAGDGVDFVLDSAGANDRVRFAPGIAPADVTVTRAGVDLVFSVGPSGDVLIVRSFFAASTNEIESVLFEDGTVWDSATIKDLASKISGSGGADTLVGTGAADRIYGLAGNDSLSGLDGDDLLDGGVGNDTMVGGMGNDTFVVDSTADVVTEASGQGTDTIQSSVTITTLASNVETLVLTGAAAINGTGNTLANIITGNSAANALSGGSGADTLIGGTGNDTYAVDNTGDVTTELAGEGTDLVQSSVNHTLAANVENLTLTGSSGLSGTGNELDNVLTGNSGANALTGGAGNDRLDGGSGNDTMAGGIGNDTYVVNAIGDQISEQIGEGIDTIESSIALTLGSNVENLVLTGSSGNAGTGNALDNVLTGNSGTNALSGGAGNDTYVVGTGDTVTEGVGAGIDTIMSAVNWTTLANNVENVTLTGSTAVNATGNTLNNVLSGNTAVNTLNGGTGTDTMIGGAGDDIYVVDNAGDVVTELVGEGTDLVQSSVNHTLAANVENLTLTGSSGLSATGNALDNVLTGNSGANAMAGGAGNDTYVVGTGDTVTEAAGAGTDTVMSAITWTLASTNNVENLTLTGSSAANATGNALDNVLTGNSGTNTLTGGAGNDTYVVGTGDTTTEAAGAGTDTVMSAITWTLATNLENLTLTGTSAITGTGNTLDNLLLGNSGANTLQGLVGNDTYDGGAGNDALTDNSTTSNDVYRWGIGSATDTITDSGGTDRVEIGAGITAGQLAFARNGNNLEVTASGITDKLIVSGWYATTANRMEEFRLADGSTVPMGGLPQLVFAPRETFSASGEEGFESRQRQTIEPVRMPAAGALVEGGVVSPRWTYPLSQLWSAKRLGSARFDAFADAAAAGANGAVMHQVQQLVSAMAMFSAANEAGLEGSARQTIQPVQRTDPMWVTPALM